MGTPTGDGALRALGGKAELCHLDAGTRVTPAGLEGLRDVPLFSNQLPDWLLHEARASDAERWAGTIASVRQLADAYGFTDTDGSKPDCWGHLAKYGWDNDDERGIDEFR